MLYLLLTVEKKNEVMATDIPHVNQLQREEGEGEGFSRVVGRGLLPSPLAIIFVSEAFPS